MPIKPITKEIVDEYNIRKLRYDFMGYTFNRVDELSFHHLIVPRRLNGAMTKENGCVLVQSTSHDYLHRIEMLDYDMFFAITSEMIDENIKGKLDIENLRRIRDILLCFEREYSGARTKKGSRVIRPEYVNKRIIL